MILTPITGTLTRTKYLQGSRDMVFYCILSDELGEHFHVRIIAHDMADAIQILREQYPESGIVDVRR